MEASNFEIIAKTLSGLEDVLAEELQAIGAEDVTAGKRMVSFRGDNRMLYRANFCCRTAIRILKPVASFKAHNADTVYDEVKKIEWDRYISKDRTFTIDAVVYSESFNHSKFVAYRTKDAIADYFNEKYGKRPSVSIKNPDYYINIHISHNDCTVSLDSSGESLHRRGYRVSQGEAPLSEVLAAGMILKTGWRGESDFTDPFCGSGTLLIEAAMIALNIAPGVYRKEFAFERWQDFDKELFEEIYNDESGERDFDFKCYGSDISPKAVENAENNVKSAGLSKYIELKVSPFQQYTEAPEKGIFVTNPPYGERISADDILEMYGMIGERLKHVFAGYDAWILSYKEEYFDMIGLKPKHKIKLMNGELECEYRCYELFAGKNRDFKKAQNEEGRTPRRREDTKERRDERPKRRMDDRDNGEKREWTKGRRDDGAKRQRDERPKRRMGERENGEKKEWTKGRRDDGAKRQRDERPKRRMGERENGEKKEWPKRRRDEAPFQEKRPFRERDFDSKKQAFENSRLEERELRQERSERHNRLAARHHGLADKERRTKRNEERRLAETDQRPTSGRARPASGYARPKTGRDFSKTGRARPAQQNDKPYKKKRYED